MSKPISPRNMDIIKSLGTRETQRSIAARHGISITRVQQIGARYGCAPRFNRISDAELADLKAQYERGVPFAHMDSDRDHGTIANALERAGVHKPIPHPPGWPPRADAVLSAMWGKHPCAAIAQVLGTTKNAVIGRAHRLGLRSLKKRVLTPCGDAAYA